MERPARSVALVGHPRWRGRCHYRKEPAVMSSVRQRRDRIYLGLDVHKDSISAGILGEYDDTVDVDKIFHDEDSVRRLIRRFPDPRSLRVCYEAGPTNGLWAVPPVEFDGGAL